MGAHSSIIEDRPIRRSVEIHMYANYKMGNYPECPHFEIRQSPPVLEQSWAWLVDLLWTQFSGEGSNKRQKWDDLPLASTKPLSKHLGMCLKLYTVRWQWKRNWRKYQVSTSRRDWRNKSQFMYIHLQDRLWPGRTWNSLCRHGMTQAQWFEPKGKSKVRQSHKNEIGGSIPVSSLEGPLPRHRGDTVAGGQDWG